MAAIQEDILEEDEGKTTLFSDDFSSLNLRFLQLLLELFDSRSTSSLRPNSSTSSDSIKVTKKDLIDVNESPQSSPSAPVKVLLVNGTCSEIFRSALENSVEDCILQYPGDKAVYIPKCGPAIPLPAGNHQNSVLSLREASAQTRQSNKSARRRNSINPLPQIGSGRHPFSLSPNRMRQQLVQQKFSLGQDIFEETTIEQFPKSTMEQSSSTPVRIASRYSHPTVSSKKTHLSYRDRQKNYRLSDLVMLGPEYFAHVFNLPRTSKPLKSHENKDELERIKQDLFHRYLWTQKPQVSCRICPMSAYTRSATFAM